MTTHTFFHFILDHLGIILDILQLFVVVGAGIICFLWIRPADKKLQQLQSELQRQTDKVDSIRSAVMDAGVGYQIEQHRTLVKEYLLVFRAFQKILSSSSVLQWAQSLKDLGAIKRQNRPAPNIKLFFASIAKSSPDDWMKASVFENVQEAELFVSDKTWKLYSLAKTLLLSFQLQLRELELDTDESIVTNEGIKQLVAELFPEHLEQLNKDGTTYYYPLLIAIRQALIPEIKSEINKTPLDPKPLSEFSAIAEDLSYNVELSAFPTIPDYAKR